MTASNTPVLTLCFIFFVTLAHAQFHSNHPYNHTLADIHFTDYSNGYAVGRDIGIGSCSPSNAGMFRTMDAGKTWVRSAMDDSYELTAIQMLDQTTGWAVGYFGKSYRTTNCGATWTEYNTGAAYDLTDVFFLNNTLGFCVSENGRIRKTTDGGVSWFASVSGVTSTLNSIYFIDANLGFAVGNSGTILRTQNGGSSWTAYNTGIGGANYHIEFIDDQKGFISSYNRIYKTENAGDSWVEIPLPIGPIRGMDFPTAAIGYLMADLGQAMKTVDGGNTWQPMNFPFKDAIYSIHFLDAYRGYASGDGGSIFFTGDGGVTWRSQHSGLNFSFGVEEFYGIDFIFGDTGIICGENGGIGITLNGGLSWSSKPSGTEKILFETQWLTENRLIVAGADGTVLLSSDGGESWDPADTGYDLDYSDLWFSDDGLTGYLMSFQDSLVKTTDGGMSWQLQVIPSGSYFRELDFWDNNHGVLVASDAVYRTLDGGTTWTEQPYLNAQGSLRSLDVVNDTLSFIGAVNMLKSTNGGASWDSIDTQNNLWPESVEFLNDTLGYFVSGPNVRFTDNGGQNWYAVTTACLANSWAHNKIEVIDEHHVYNTGKTPMTRLWSGPPTITTTLQNNTFCPGSKLNVGYFYEGAYTSGNTYVAQISDANGSFAAPVNIGQYISPFVANNPSNIISCALPGGLPTGNNYRIRVVGLNPQLIGSDNGEPLTISNNIQPDISLVVSGEGCPGSPLFFEATFNNGGPFPQFQWLVNGIPNEHTGFTWTTDTLQNGDMIQVVMTADLSCASPLLVSSQTLMVNSGTPDIMISADTIICLGQSVPLFVSGGESYLWSPVTGLDDPTSSAPLATPLQSTTYNLLITLQGGCTVSNSVFVAIQPPPNLVVSDDVIINFGESVMLFASGADTYQWSPAAGLDNPLSAQPVSSSGATTTYHVIGTDDLGCSSVDSVTVTVLLPAAPQIVDFEASDTTILAGESISYTNTTTGEVAEWLWSFAGGNPATAIDSIPGFIQYDEVGCYVVSLSAINPGGGDFLEKTCYIQVTEEVVGVHEINNRMLIWPNPASDRFWVEDDQSGEKLILVFDGLGREVLRENYVGIKKEIRAVAWPHGVYSILLFEKDAVRMGRVVIGD